MDKTKVRIFTVHICKVDRRVYLHWLDEKESPFDRYNVDGCGHYKQLKMESWDTDCIIKKEY